MSKCTGKTRQLMNVHVPLTARERERLTEMALDPSHSIFMELIVRKNRIFVIFTKAHHLGHQYNALHQKRMYYPGFVSCTPINGVPKPIMGRGGGTNCRHPR